MFNERHYVPILRWKRGERWALKQLAEADKQRLTPLIELPPSLFTLASALAIRTSEAC